VYVLLITSFSINMDYLNQWIEKDLRKYLMKIQYEKIEDINCNKELLFLEVHFSHWISEGRESFVWNVNFKFSTLKHWRYKVETKSFVFDRNVCPIESHIRSRSFCLLDSLYFYSIRIFQNSFEHFILFMMNCDS